MTAVKKYALLEAGGLWRENPRAQRRDVTISFGEASLIIRDSRDQALAHWSLPAIERLNPGKRPALYQPAPDSHESLEIEDAKLIDALETIRTSLARRRPKHGRLRLFGFIVTLCVLALLGVFWLPDALVRQTLSVVPNAKRAEIGSNLLTQLARLTGPPCQTQGGKRALAGLKTRVSSADISRLEVVPGGARDTILLPGNLLVLNRRLAEDHDSPAVLAGYMLQALEEQGDRDPLEELLVQAGPRATLGLLTTGDMAPRYLADHAEYLLSKPTGHVPEASLIERFQSADIPMSPFAYAKDVTGQSTAQLISADPYAGQSQPSLLSDGDWISLQAICGN